MSPAAEMTDSGSQQPEVENTCKNCGRYIGPIVTCPFCGHRTRRRSAVRITRNAALAVAVIGLLALHIWSMGYGSPAMNIEDLNETSNYAYVEISGIVTRAPVYYPGDNGAAGTMYFTVDDGTGEISVRAYPNPVVEDMLATGKIPGYGDRVNVTGNVYWYNAERGFILNSLEQLDIDRPEPMNMSISDIVKLDSQGTQGYYRVRTFGTVDSWRKYYSALDITLIDENDNEISVYVPNSVFDLTGTGDLGTLEMGMGLEVVGCLEYYDAGSYSKWEIIPATTSDVTRAQPDLAVKGIEVSDVNFPLNQQFTVNVTVANDGRLPVAKSTLSIMLNGDANNTYNYTVISLGAGESVVVSYNTAITDLSESLTVTASISVSEPLEDTAPGNNLMTYTEGS